MAIIDPRAERKVSILLNGTVDNRSEDEFAQPIIVQGVAPKLRQSTNTRLGARGGSVTRSPQFTEVITGTSEIPGFPRFSAISAKAGRNTLLIATPGSKGGNVVGDAGREPNGTGSLISTFFGEADGQKNACVPRVSAAGALGSTKPLSAVSNVYNSTFDQLWHAYVGEYNVAAFGIFAQCMNGSNSEIAAPGVIGPTTGAYSFATPISSLCLTSHGANGVRLWWVDNSTHQVMTTRLSISTPRQIRNDSNASLATAKTAGAVYYGISACSGGDQFAYVGYINTSGDAVVMKVDVTAGTTTLVSSVTVATSTCVDCAVASEMIRGTRYVIAGASRTTASTVAAYTANLAPLWSPAATSYAAVGMALGFADNSVDTPNAIYALRVEGASFSAAPNTTTPNRSTLLWVPLLTGGTPTVGTELLWRTPACGMTQWSPVSGMTMPILALMPNYGDSSNPSSPDYVDDPSLDIYLAYVSDSIARITPIARLGCLRGGQSPVLLGGGAGLSMSGSTLFASYRQVDLGGLPGDIAGGGRYARLDFSPAQLSVVHDRDGSASIASALPYTWDGTELFPMGGFLHTPRLVLLDSGSADNLALGVYSFIAVTQWIDASGDTHRSRPSKVVTWTKTAAPDWRLYVEVPTSFAVGGPSVAMTIASVKTYVYSTTTNGLDYHLMAILEVSGPVTMTPVTEDSPQVYTSQTVGEELAPQPPPPAWDIANIGPRCWILDSENRARWVYSKLRVAGIGYEFVPSFEVIAPSGAGLGMAAREWNGAVILICEHGIYQVSGDGPDNTGNNGAYYPPVKISDLGCSSTASIVTFPGGILWQYQGRFVRLDGNGVAYVPDFVPTYDVTAAICLPRYSEILLFSSALAEVRVYHYETSRWTTWDSQTLPDPVTQVSLCPWDTDTVVVYSQSTGITRRLDATSFSTATNMTWATDWMLLGGDFQDHVILHELWLSALIAGPHGVQVDLYVDYESTPSTSRSWTASEVTALANAEGRYTLQIEPQQQNGRAFQLVIKDVVDPLGANTQGMSPRAVTLVYKAAGMLFEEVRTPGASFK